MRTNYSYNRQARRAAICIGPRDPRDHKLASSLKRAALVAHGHDLAQVAARIGDELELSGEMIDFLLSPVRPAPSAAVGSQRELWSDGWTPDCVAQASAGGARQH